MDQFTETARTGYGANIGNSLKGILFGLILIVGSIILLWWNESRSVNQADALNEMSAKIVTLPDTIYHPEHENKAVLVQGEVKPISQIVDPLFGVKLDGLVLRRSVEMYQWKENTSSKTEEKLGGSTETVTTYTYVKEWSSSSISSSSFKHPEGHHNPSMNYKSETFVTDANIGGYYLSKNMIGKIGTSRTYDGLSSMPKKIGMAANHMSFLYIGQLPQNQGVVDLNNSLKIGVSNVVSSPQNPRVGDVKISYTYAPAGHYSIAAKSQNKSLVNYTTSNNRSFAFIRSGVVSAQQIFQQELDANSTLTWILRFVGLLMMFIGFTLVMGPLATFAKVIPMLGSLVGGVTSVVAGILTLLLGSIIISLAWFASRPMLSLAIIGISIAAAVGLAKFGKKKEAPVDTAPSPKAETPSAPTPPERKKD